MPIDTSRTCGRQGDVIRGLLKLFSFGLLGVALAWLLIFIAGPDTALESSADRQQEMAVSGASQPTPKSIGVAILDDDSDLPAATQIEPDRPRAAVTSMDVDQQKHVFWLTLRDAGYDCDEVLEAQMLGSDAMAWRASCGQALVYWIALDERGNLSAEPAAYGDIDRAIPETRTLELKEIR
jgi:hypothetical protein